MSIPPEERVIHLHKREKSGNGYWGHPGICTVTFCDGDARTALASLIPRVRSCLAKNPWIAGRLDAKKRLVYDPPSAATEASDADEIVSTTKSAAVSRSTPYPELVRATGGNRDMAVQSGGKLQKTGGRVTKIMVVESEAEGRSSEFAIIFSMSHVVADGHDYYRIFDMILGGAEVVELRPERMVEYEAREAEWTGKDDFNWISGGSGLMKGMLNGLLCGPKSEWCCHKVDMDKVSLAKREAAASAAKDSSFVSTNDVLTSHFCTAAAARIGMMVINMRGKIDLPITDNHAGCYEGCLLLDEPNYRNPSGIRACLDKGAPYTRQAEGTRPLPGICGSCPMALITNWASFKWNIALEGVQRTILHLPCMAMPDMMDVAVVFRPRPDELAVMYLAKRSRGKLLGEGTVLGEVIDDGIFPQK